MLGLRFFECRRCATVYAGPDAPPYCSDCPGHEFAELTDRLRTEAYFSPHQDR
jgi:rubredoxin